MTTATEGTAPTSPPGGEELPLLRLRGVSKHFGPVQALTEVDLDIPAGQVTALAGDNGAGKSVLIKTISGNHLVERAGREDRVLLSRDRGLLMRKALRRAAFVHGQHPDAQLDRKSVV